MPASLAIIAALIAIAIPTFVERRPPAEVTTAKANVKQLVSAIESCAASRTDGTYRGSDPSMGPDCLDTGALVELEPALSELVLYSTVPREGGYQVAPVGTDGMGYIVQAATQTSSNGKPVWYAELHLSNGEVLNLCDSAPLSPTDRTSVDFDVDGCDNGTW